MHKLIYFYTKANLYKNKHMQEYKHAQVYIHYVNVCFKALLHSIPFPFIPA